MLISYLSPLAPAAILLLSAFILHGVVPSLPPQWQQQPALRYLNKPVLVGLALLSLLGINYTPGVDAVGAGLELLSGWSFNTSRSAAALAIRVDSLSLPFLLTALLVLLAAALLNTDTRPPGESAEPGFRAAGSLLLGAAASLLFVAANGLTVVHAALLFDVVSASLWLTHRQNDAALGHLFLGITTTAGLLFATILADQQPMVAQLILGGALWLRLAVFPFVSMTKIRQWQRDEQLTYHAMSLLAGLYLAVRVINQPLPWLIHGLAIVSMLLLGGRVWLMGQNWRQRPPQPDSSQPDRLRYSLLNLLVLGESLLILLAAPVSIETAAALAMALGLSYVALWVTPALGQPKLAESAWSWPYLPAVTATLTLLGVPYSLGWLIRIVIFDMLGSSWLLAAGVVAAESLLLSSLYFYWQHLLRGSETSLRRSVIGIVAMVPFLTPGLAFFILSALTQLDLWTVTGAAGWGAAGYVVLISALAFAAGNVQPAFVGRLQLQPAALAAPSPLAKLLHKLAVLFGVVSRLMLRIQVVLEGQHYLGWAVFVALVGTLIILLS